MTRFENDHTEDHPMATEIEPGTYYWCQCGKTQTPPYCDGTHAGTGVSPLAFLITEPGTVAVCNCGLTSTPPYCDGSHAAIE